MTGFVLWMALLTVAGLCYPRAPRVAGAVFIVLGALTIHLTAAGRPGLDVLTFAPGAGWFVLGTSHLIGFRNPARRAQHLAFWTAKS